MAYDIRLTTEIEGLESVAAAFRQLTKAEQRKYLIPIFKKCARPTVIAMKSLAPVSSKRTFATSHNDIDRKTKAVITRIIEHKPGELKRSIGYSVSKKGATLWIGPNRRSAKKNDAYYWLFVSKGHAKRGRFSDKSKGITKTQPPNDYLQRAWDKTRSNVLASIDKAVKEFLEQRNNKAS